MAKTVKGHGNGVIVIKKCFSMNNIYAKTDHKEYIIRTNYPQLHQLGV